MPGDDNRREGMFSYISREKRVPPRHPLRRIRKVVDKILKEMSHQFAKLYSDVGRVRRLTVKVTAITDLLFGTQ